jgi:carbon starvation protein
LGDRDRAVTLFKGSMAAILVAAFGQNVLLSVIASLGGWSFWSAQAGQVAGYPGAGTAIYVMAFIMLLLAAINLARGHVAEGGWMIIGSVLALAVVVFATQAFSTTVIQYGGGPLLVEARTDKLFYEPAPRDGVILYVTVRASGLAVDKVNVTVDWGDGTRSYQEVPVGKETIICAPPPSSPIATIANLISGGTCWKKLYYVSGDEAQRGAFFTINVNATYKNLLRGGNSVVIYVRELPGLPFPFSGLSGYVNTVLSSISGGMLDANKLLYSPVFKPDGPEGAWYSRTLTLAVMVLPVFMLFRIAPGLAYDPGRAIVDGFRDAALAVIAMLLIPHAYNVTANVLNTFTDGIGGPAGATLIAQLAGSALAWGALFILISLASPGAGFIGGTMLLAVALVAILGTVRWFLLQAIVIASPLLVLAWLHPALRGAASQLYGMVGSMMLAGPITALFLLLIAGAFLEGNILKTAGGSFALSLAGIFIVGFLPQILSFLAVTGLERMAAARIEAAATRAVPQMGRAVATGAVRGAAAAGAAGYAALAGAAARNVRFARPLMDTMRSAGAMVGKARATISKALTGVQHGIEDRVARLTAMVESERKIRALEGVKARVQEISSIKNPRARRKEAGELTVRLGELADEGILSREQYAELLEHLEEDPAETVKAVDRMIEETEEAAQEYEQLDEYRKQKLKADLAFLRIAAQPIATGIGNTRGSTRELEERALRKIGLIRGRGPERQRQKRREWMER